LTTSCHFIPIIKLRSVRGPATAGAKLNCPLPSFVEMERDLLKSIGARQPITTAILLINDRARDRNRSRRRAEQWNSGWYCHAAWGTRRARLRVIESAVGRPSTAAS